jgi:hypothetical protein
MAVLDFLGEYQKQKQKMALFNKVIDKQEEYSQHQNSIKETGTAILEHDAHVRGLNLELQLAKEERVGLKRQLSALHLSHSISANLNKRGSSNVNLSETSHIKTALKEKNLGLAIKEIEEEIQVKEQKLAEYREGKKTLESLMAQLHSKSHANAEVFRRATME